MDKKILLLASDKIDFITLEVIKELNNQIAKIVVLSDKKNNEHLSSEVYKFKRIFLTPNNKFAYYFFYPVWLVRAYWLLFDSRKKENINYLFCLNKKEKNIFTLAGFLLKIPVTWLEDLSSNQKTKTFSRLAKIVCFNNFYKNKAVLNGLPEKNIHLVPLGIKVDNSSFQDNLFSSLARNEHLQANKKYFTLGTVTNLDQDNQLENIFHAVKKSLEIIPNIQLIVAGEGEEKKKYIWLAKKMGIENLVWFVGKPENINKWLKNFQLYLSSNNQPNFSDWQVVLQAMANNLPIITSEEDFFSDLLINEKSCLINKSGQSEELAQHIISLYKNTYFRNKLGKQASSLIAEKFTLKNTMEKIKEIL